VLWANQEILRARHRIVASTSPRMREIVSPCNETAVINGEYERITNRDEVRVKRMVQEDVVWIASSRAASLNGLNRHSTASRATKGGRTALSPWPLMNTMGICCRRRMSSC
jgi:hypothetical protein